MTTYTKSGKPRKKRAKTGQIMSMLDYGRRNHFPWDMAEIVSEDGTVETGLIEALYEQRENADTGTSAFRRHIVNLSQQII